MWHNGIDGISAALGHRFDPWLGIVDQGSSVATAVTQVETVVRIRCLVQELHMLRGGQKINKNSRSKLHSI